MHGWVFVLLAFQASGPASSAPAAAASQPAPSPTAVAAAASQVAESPAVRVPGTRVRLPIPEGFRPAREFAGLISDDRMTAITFEELRGGRSELRKTLTPARLAEQQMQLQGSEELKGPGGWEILHATQTVDGQLKRKWILLTGDERRTLNVVATAPLSRAEELAGAVVTALRGVRWHPDDELSFFEGLGYRVAEAGQMRIRRRQGYTLVMNRAGGAPVVVAPTEPVLTVSVAYQALEPGQDLEAFARERFMHAPLIDGVQINAAAPLTLAGLEAVELIGEGCDMRSATDLALWQVIARFERGYFIFVGVVGAANADVYLAQFREVAQTLRPDGAD